MGRWWIGVAFALGCHCQAKKDPPPVETPVAVAKPAPGPAGPLLPELEPADIITANQPTATEVAIMMGRRDDRSLFVLPAFERMPQSQRIIWMRYDNGVRVLADAKSSNMEGPWHTRFRREVTAPPPVKRESLITPADAKARPHFAPVTVQYIHNEDGVELAYKPVFGDRQRPGTRGTNAMDFASVIERYELVYLVTHGAETAVIDPYTGAERERTSSVVR